MIRFARFCRSSANYRKSVIPSFPTTRRLINISTQLDQSKHIVGSGEHEGTVLDQFPISNGTRQLLKQAGINALFPIQAATYQPIFEGKDVVGKAKTGTGKTLAFVLPLVERLLQPNINNNNNSGPLRKGNPRVLVLCPTRELAKQVQGEVQRIAGKQLSSVCIYGGVAYNPQGIHYLYLTLISHYINYLQ
jgi:superfamily II DNA/RNA helicase